MAIESWTSEGMDWSDPESFKGRPLLPCMEALRLALAERLLAKGLWAAFPKPSYFPSDIHLAFLGPSGMGGGYPSPESGFPAQVDYLLFDDNGGFGGLKLPQYFSRIDQMAFPSDSMPDPWTIEDMLSYLGETKIELDRLGTNIAEWACQRCRLINLLRYSCGVYINTTWLEKRWSWNGSVTQDWSLTSLNFFDALAGYSNLAGSRRVKGFATIGGLPASLEKRQLLLGKVSGPAPGGDFDPLGAVDASGSALQLNKIHALAVSGFTFDTSIPFEYGNSDVFPGNRASAYAGWCVYNWDSLHVHDYKFKFRDWET